MKAKILNRFAEIRGRTQRICEPLSIKDFVPQPVDFVSPPKWHLAHTTWFFEEFILKKHLPGYQEFDKDFGYLFNSYYNTIGKRVLRADRGNMTRPTVDRILQYREYVDTSLRQLCYAALSENVEALIEIGLNHEQQHQELLLTDIKYILGHNPLFPKYKELFTENNSQTSKNGWHQVNSGLYDIGASRDGFSYDNEHSRHRVYLDEYRISHALVTNHEYLEFIEDGGYSRHELWLDEGWAWINEKGIKSPLYWHFIDGSWFQYTMSGLTEISMDSSLCHVSHYEAAAFADWKGMRLPTEFEWEVASPNLSWGHRWEHTNSAYLAYPGFKKPAGAVGEYNGKFMMNQMVLRGASVATSPDHSRNTYRNFFHPNMQWQFSGIRLVKNE